MKVFAINSLNYSHNTPNITNNIQQANGLNYSSNVINLNLQPNNYPVNISFKAHELSKEPLFAEYKNSDATNFVDFIRDTDVRPAEMYNFLLAVTADENASSELIRDLNFNPQNADKITKLLVDKLGGQDRFKMWYYNPNGYQRAYERYFKKEIFENDNVSVNDMVKIQPNLMVEALKLKSLKTTGDMNFVIGHVPEDIGSVEDFRALTEEVRNSKLVKEFIKFRDFMENPDEFSKKFPEAKEMAINPARFAKDFIKIKMSEYRKTSDPQRKKELEKEIPFLKYMNETTVKVNGKSYTYTPILRPYSTKILFALQPENTDNKYFVTMEMFNPKEDTCENIMNKENSAMRSDSPYLNALVDFYLRANGCTNVPEMKFYDYKSNAVVYPFIKGESIQDKFRTDKYGVINEYEALNNEMAPLTKLGIFITDCFFENFMQDSKTGQTIIVDNGHAKFSNVLKPGVKMIHMGFMDLYGRDYVSLDAGLNRAANK